MASLLLDRLKETSLLIVEDDEIAIFGLEQGLKDHCKAVYLAKDGMEGIELYRQHQVDIIIADIHLPIINGFDMMREVLKINPSQKFIVMTSYDSDKNILESITEGAYLFLKKPISIENLQTQLLLMAAKESEQLISLSSNIKVNPTKQVVYKNSEVLTLSYRNNNIFWLLFNNLNRTVSYDVIQDYIYDDEYVSKSAIRMAVSRVASIIGKDLIENISGIGYMLKSKT